MAGRFLSHLSIILVLNLLVKPVYILWIEVGVQNAVGASSYGLYFALLNTAYLFQILNDFGLQIFGNREIARNSAQIQQLFPRLLSLKALLAVLFTTGVVLLATVLGYRAYFDLLLPIIVNLILVSLVLFLRSGVSGLGYYRMDSVLSVLDKFILIFICAWLLYLSEVDFTIYHFVYAQMSSLVITVLVCLLMLFLKGAFNKRGDASQSRLGSLIRMALPYALAVFLMSVYTRIDGVMIEKIASDGKYQAGLYAAGYRLLDAANMVAYLFAVLLLPMFSRLLGKREATLELIDQAFRSMLILTVGAAVVCFLNRSEIMGFLYPESTAIWDDTFGILILSFVAIGMMYVFGTFLTARGDIAALNRLYLACVIMNILLNMVLIPRFGAYGAGVATLATQSAATLALILMTRNMLQIRFSIPYMTRALGFIAGAIAVTVIIAMLLQGMHWPIRALLQGLCIAGLAGALGVIDLRAIRRFTTEKSSDK